MTATVRDFLDAPIPPHLQLPVLLPEGETELAYISHRLITQFNRGILLVWFAAVDYRNIAIPRYYPVQRKGKSAFIAPRGGVLVADFQRVFTRRIQRLDRFPIAWLQGECLLGEIGTVTKDANQDTREEGTEYTVVRKLIKCF